jgi:hypothetical protein
MGQEQHRSAGDDSSARPWQGNEKYELVEAQAASYGINRAHNCHSPGHDQPGYNVHLHLPRK